MHCTRQVTEYPGLGANGSIAERIHPALHSGASTLNMRQARVLPRLWKSTSRAQGAHFRVYGQTTGTDVCAQTEHRSPHVCFLNIRISRTWHGMQRRQSRMALGYPLLLYLVPHSGDMERANKVSVDRCSSPIERQALGVQELKSWKTDFSTKLHNIHTRPTCPSDGSESPKASAASTWSKAWLGNRAAAGSRLLSFLGGSYVMS